MLNDAKTAEQNSPIKKSRGKKEARRTVRAGLIPGFIYGAFKDPVAIAIDPKAVNKIIRSKTGHNTIFNIEVKDIETSPVMVVDERHDPVRGHLLHVDLKRIDLTKRIRVFVPITISGQPAGVKTQGGRLEVSTRSVEIETLPDEIPENYTIDVSDMMIGDSRLASDILLSGSTKLISLPKAVIAQVVGRKLDEAAPSVELAAIAKHDDVVEGLTRSWASIHAPLNQIQAVVKLATDVFGSEKVAEEWLNNPNLATNDSPPLALLGTESGYDRVKLLLLRIDYGVLT